MSRKNELYRALLGKPACTLAASLEMCKSGQLEMRQDGTYGPIYLRARPEAGAGDDPTGDRGS